MISVKIFIFLVSLSAISASASQNKKKIVCYFPNWSTYSNGEGKFNASDVHPFSCSHIMYAFAGIKENGAFEILDSWSDFDLGQIGNITALKKINKDLKVMISIGGWNEGSSKYSIMANDPERRARFINTTTEAILKHDFDGMDLDWEYPGRNGGSESIDKKNLVVLLKELRQVFDEHNLLLSAAVAPAGTFVDISYDIPALSKYLDLINLMEYDYHGTWNGYTGHNAPLFVSPNDITPERKSWNINSSVKKWLSGGADPNKLILGVPFYGHSFKLDNASDVSLGSKAWIPGPPGHYLGIAGTYGYHEICEYILEGNWTIVWDKFSLVPYMYKDGIWVSYDNVESIKWKAQYAKTHNLGGVMVWSLATDDFRGHCGKKNILMHAIHEVLGWST